MGGGGGGGGGCLRRSFGAVADVRVCSLLKHSSNLLPFVLLLSPRSRLKHFKLGSWMLLPSFSTFSSREPPRTGSIESSRDFHQWYPVSTPTSSTTLLQEAASPQPLLSRLPFQQVGAFVEQMLEDGLHFFHMPSLAPVQALGWQGHCDYREVKRGCEMQVYASSARLLIGCWQGSLKLLQSVQECAVEVGTHGLPGESGLQPLITAVLATAGPFVSCSSDWKLEVVSLPTCQEA